MARGQTSGGLQQATLEKGDVLPLTWNDRLDLHRVGLRLSFLA